MMRFVIKSPLRCFLCGEIMRGRKRTGPDGYSTLCHSCHIEYRDGSVSVYQNFEDNRYTVVKQENGRVFEVIGFERKRNGIKDLRKPIVRERESDSRAFLRSFRKRTMEEYHDESQRLAKKLRYNGTEDDSTLTPQSAEYGDDFPDEAKVDRVHNIQRAKKDVMLNLLLQEEKGRVVSRDEISLKAYLRVDGRKIVRRFSIAESTRLTELHSVIDRLFGATMLSICYRDDENDVITMNTDNELGEMIKLAKRTMPVPVTLVLLSNS